MANLKILNTPCAAHGVINCSQCGGAGSVSATSAATASGVLVDRVIVQSPGDEIHPGPEYEGTGVGVAVGARPAKTPAVKSPAVILKASKGG